jgi:signal transduction histidine kinase
LLKLHQIYLKILIILFVILFVLLGVEVYFWTKGVYIDELKSLHLSTEIINHKLQSFDIEFVKFAIKISLILSIFIMLFFLFIYRINKNLEKEVLKILTFLKSLTKKKRGVETIESNFSEEFNKITSLLTKVSRILLKQDRQNIAYTSKLELSNIQKDEIISAISHEFKNPITIINGYSETLLQDEEIPNELRKKFLEKIKKNGDKLTSLIDKLRLAIRLDENKQEIEFKKVNIYNLLLDVIEDVKDLYNREIILEGGQNLIAEVDEMLMGIVLKNLIENGIKYSEGKIIVKLSNNSISVIDNGIGLTEEEIKKVTDKFYRVTNNSWNNSLGLGLSIVSNILKLHNFSLEIKSEKGKGSKFIIKLTSL